ncbi:hypothetical protein JF729_14650 [Mycobacterium intracellulare]|uniref:major capsid protein n=1 Tax=Mycobacterium intracellulare TaxID=1767 RepID=UPI001CD9995B|nr:major capsid protein [Mycobacterium intracellulare]MCA2249022.1 hypothetical protein [Mycobacterium intracellulare]
MPNPLVPSISGNQVSLSALLDNPARLNALIAKLAADMLIVDAFFRPSGTAVTGGSLLYDVLLSGGNYPTRDVQERSPGAEYIITTGDVTRDLATPQDWGAKVQILDEERVRFDQVVISNRLIQLANGIARKIDQIAIAAVELALSKYSIAGVSGHDWGSLITVGPLDQITPNNGRPSADIANAALLARADDTGVKPPDTLVCHPQQLTALRIGYGSELNDVLASVGITDIRTSMQVTVGTAYVVASGAAGVLAFEPSPFGVNGSGLVTEVIPDRQARSTWIQSYAVPVFAVPVPGAIRKITGLAG